jgi:hypothetical protein
MTFWVLFSAVYSRPVSPGCFSGGNLTANFIIYSLKGKHPPINKQLNFRHPAPEVPPILFL